MLKWKIFIKLYFVLIIYYKKMESKNVLKEINIKNHTSYYFNDIIKIKDFDINNILVDENHTKTF